MVNNNLLPNWAPLVSYWLIVTYTPISLAGAYTTIAKSVQIAEKRHGSQYERDTNDVNVAEVPRSAMSGSRRRFFWPYSKQAPSNGDLRGSDKKRHSNVVENPLS